MVSRVVLFDMDGTLTPARKEIEWSTVVALRELSKHSKIGIVTGSGFNYLSEQCGMLWKQINSCSPQDIILLPCNGTQKYVWSTNTRKFEKVSSVDMKEEIGDVHYNSLIDCLLKIQTFFISYTRPSCSLSGTFLSYRGSLLNFCPIGRDSTNEERSNFVKLDNNNLLRNRLTGKLKEELDRLQIENIEIRLGGQTSLDIFPTGWDKSYVLKHFPDTDVYFVGDRCTVGGNDYDLYMVLKHENRFVTKGPENTRNIAYDLLNRFK